MIENPADKGLEIWKEWFEYDGHPWVEDECGNVDCFFCGGIKPDHEEDCTFLKAQLLLDQIEI